MPTENDAISKNEIAIITGGSRGIGRNTVLSLTGTAAALGVGAFLIALLLARRFGRFNGGNAPDDG
jgi:NAD(P)-dependent dehydrogenase (short-subunit alcohol dehydrogenase family)